MSDPVQKITFAETRAAGVRDVLVYCSDYRCSHSTRLDADRWLDDIRLSDIEPKFVCAACDRRGADVRLDWHSLEARRSGASLKDLLIPFPTRERPCPM